MIFLRTIERLGDVEDGSGFPFNLPPVRGFRKLELKSSVTFLVGENGSGKSTLLEAIALRAKMPCPTGASLEHDPSLVPIHPLARSLRLVWTPQTKYGFFLRVEDFFMHTRKNRTRSEPAEAVAVSMDPEARVLTSGRVDVRYREEFEMTGQSSGESFLNFLQDNCVPGGLHLIDEPEAALSPQRQLAFMSLVKSVVGENAQFIIATHSPILLAYPRAQILSFDDGTIHPVNYNELPHVNFTRNFLDDPESYLRTL